MKNVRKTKRAGSGAIRPRGALIPTLVASGACGLMSSPAGALQLGDIEVNSSLGQPLRASIAFALGPHEQLAPYCISLRPPAAGMPGLGNARLTIANGRINIAGSAPLREPMVGLGVTVDCPYTARIARDYSLLIDPAPATASNVRLAARPQAAPAITEPATTANPATSRSAPLTSTANVTDSGPSTTTREPASAAVADQPTIDPTREYRVQPGDTLYGIATRIDERAIGLWSATVRLFDANPGAFIDGDINRLKAGSVLLIPSLDADAPEPASLANREPVVAAPETVGAVDGYGGFTAADVDSPSEAEAEPLTGTPSAAAEPVSDAPARPSMDAAPPSPLPVARPGALDPAPVAEPVESRAEATGTITRSERQSAREPATVIAPTDLAPVSAYGYRSELAAFGAGVLLTGALALIGWRIRRRRELPPPVLTPAAAADDEATAENPTLDLFTVAEAGDSQLDANLDNGDGFAADNDVEVAEDFAFSTTRDLGATIEAESATAENTAQNPVIAPRFSETMILEKEVLPTHDEEAPQYDVSMIVDATRQDFENDHDNVTTRDLKAVVAEADDLSVATRELDAISEQDYEILEQDYEDELTASQILEREVAKAALALDASLNGNSTPADDAGTEELTAVLDPGSTSTSLLDSPTAVLSTEVGSEDEFVIDGDITAEIPAARAETRDLNDTQAGTERTTRLGPADNDETAELTVESGHFKTGS